MFRYVDCQMRLGADFDSTAEYRWAREILEHRTLTATRKMDQIVERLRVSHLTSDR